MVSEQPTGYAAVSTQRKVSIFKEQRSAQTPASCCRGRLTSVLGSLLPLKEFFKIQGSCHTPNTVVLTFCVNVSIKSQQAMKTAMTPMSFARIRPFAWLWAKTTLMRQASHFCQDLKTKFWVTGRDFKLWTVCSNGASIPS